MIPPREGAPGDDPGESTRRLDRIVELWAQELVARMDQPYAVMVRSTWLTEYLGPFPSALAAASAAELETRANGSLPVDEQVSVRLLPLRPPTDNV
ncbi:hypothetical protein KVF89_19105 [Nocardioides carbamazepini]|uniref:hypothetical protein n=1 Tax=Nocardioides carbamazepini TaxID=2854259 RepID=UPI00214A4BFD|nr:hypothetical protein [Nocardioides carbamazepini]MCR1784660.1 hypothetical protein [Nocardioides carbamazepini]